MIFELVQNQHNTIFDEFNDALLRNRSETNLMLYHDVYLVLKRGRSRDDITACKYGYH